MRSSKLQVDRYLCFLSAMVLPDASARAEDRPPRQSTCWSSSRRVSMPFSHRRMMLPAKRRMPISCLSPAASGLWMACSHVQSVVAVIWYNWAVAQDRRGVEGAKSCRLLLIQA